MLSELCLCGLMLFASPGWSKLDTSFLDMDPPLLSWSLSDAEYDRWEEAEYAKLSGRYPVHDLWNSYQGVHVLDTYRLLDPGKAMEQGGSEGDRCDALPLVWNNRPSDIRWSLGTR